MIAKVLTIAGSDSGGGAGIQADLKAFSAMGTYGASVITAITAQNTQAVTAVHPVPDEVVAAQIETVLSDIEISAVKIGMLGTPALIETVSRSLRDFDGPVVLDPVMVAKSGAVLLAESAIEALTAELLPRADLLTPNLPEAAQITGLPEAQTQEAVIAQAEMLQGMGAKAVLMKGGHGADADCTDTLFAGGKAHSFTAPRIQTRNTHGTGCTYSSAITARLALGEPLELAVERAHAWLHQAIRAADALDVGKGHGPVHHFHGMWG